MNRAYCLIRDLPHYRRDAFMAGLRAVGYEVLLARPGTVQRGDVLVIWNRYGEFERMADDVERRGATVLCAENGFMGRDADGHQFYQLGIGGYNGGGRWVVGEGDRLRAMGIDVAPQWRPDPGPDGHIVIRGQRGIGPRGLASPPDWHNRIAERIKRLSKRRIVIVPHPGAKAVTDTSHEKYLSGAYALVIWSSAVGVKALAMGVPVVCESPSWVCKSAAAFLPDMESEGYLRSESANALRLEALRRMAWAQWSLAEIASGEPFRLLLAQREEAQAA